MRHIRELKNLPVSQMTDEEILKAGMHRLGANFMVMIYADSSDTYSFWRYKNGEGLKNFKLAKRFWNLYNPDHKVNKKGC